MKNDIWTVFENNAADKSDKPVLTRDKNNKHLTILPGFTHSAEKPVSSVTLFIMDVAL